MYCHIYYSSTLILLAFYSLCIFICFNVGQWDFPFIPYQSSEFSLLFSSSFQWWRLSLTKCAHILVCVDFLIEFFKKYNLWLVWKNIAGFIPLSGFYPNVSIVYLYLVGITDITERGRAIHMKCLCNQVFSYDHWATLKSAIRKTFSFHDTFPNPKWQIVIFCCWAVLFSGVIL